MFPKVGRNIIEDSSVKNIFDVLMKLQKQEFTKVTLVVGEDRVNEFRRQLIKYNGVEAKHGLYNFKDGIEVVSCGERDPDTDDVRGVSSSKMRIAASSNNIKDFVKYLPASFSRVSDSIDLFNAVRIGLGFLQTNNKLQPVSERREDFVKGNILRIGDRVRIIKSNETGVITERGSNFVLVQTENTKSRVWLDGIKEV